MAATRYQSRAVHIFLRNRFRMTFTHSYRSQIAWIGPLPDCNGTSATPGTPLCNCLHHRAANCASACRAVMSRARLFSQTELSKEAITQVALNRLFLSRVSSWLFFRISSRNRVVANTSLDSMRDPPEFREIPATPRRLWNILFETSEFKLQNYFKLGVSYFDCFI